MKNVLLLGGTGFIGIPLLRKIEKNNSVNLMIHDSNFQNSSKKFKGDVLKKSTFFNEIRENEIIVNLAGQLTPQDSEFINTNILGGINLLESCVEKNIEKIVLISSINVYGENLTYPSKETDSLKPQTTYGIVKMITEKMYKYFSETYGINIEILRLAGIYGPKKTNGFLPQIIRSIKNKTIKSVCYNDGHQQRDMLYVDDVVDCIQNTIDVTIDGFNIFNVSSGKRYSMKELISLVEKISNTRIPVEYSSKIPDERCIWADNTKAKNLLTFNPKIDIETGLKFTIKPFFD